jgi:hypothetical protein
MTSVSPRVVGTMPAVKALDLYLADSLHPLYGAEGRRRLLQKLGIAIES